MRVTWLDWIILSRELVILYRTFYFATGVSKGQESAE